MTRRRGRKNPCPVLDTDSLSKTKKVSEVMEAPLFQIGAQVEVRGSLDRDLDHDLLPPFFYEATVEPAKRKNSRRGRRGYTVVCANSEERLEVDAADVRRRPPQDSRQGFSQLDMVEAFYRDAWWAAFALQRVSPAEEEAAVVYKVCIPTLRLLLELDEAQLRPHLVCQGQLWVPAANAVSEFSPSLL